MFDDACNITILFTTLYLKINTIGNTLSKKY